MQLRLHQPAEPPAPCPNIGAHSLNSWLLWHWFLSTVAVLDEGDEGRGGEAHLVSI